MFLPQAGRSAQAAKGTDEGEAKKVWVEKYRPKTIDDVSAQENTVAVLRKTLQSSNLPHMLFYGPPGTGKTSTILALARQLFGPELIKSRVLELNASDERGISVVREKIKNFAKVAVSNARVGYPCPPYKIIILDEADSMTHDAQSALRRIMEQYSRITRFCLVCNYVTRIIEPLASRCSKFRFRPLDVENTRARLEMICREENVQTEDGVLDQLIATSDGDLRRAITYLQSASRLHSHGPSPTPVTKRSIVEIAGVVPDDVVQELAEACGIEGDSMQVDRGGFAKVKGAVRAVSLMGYSSTQLLSQLHDLIVLHPTLTAVQKSNMAIYLGEADKGLVDGGDEELQLLDLCLKIRKVVAG